MASCSAGLITLALILSTTDAAPAAILVPISGPLAVKPTLRAVDSTAKRLPIKPSQRTLQLSFVRDVKPLRTISPSTAAPADGHPSVGLRDMVLVEPRTHLQRFR
jgi:hypothetical protein